MAVSAAQLLPIIVLLPLLGAVINGFFGKRFSRKWVHLIGVGTVATAFVLALRAVFALQGIAAEFPHDPNLSTTVYTWASTGMFQFDVAFYLDPLSAVMLLVVTGVGMLIHIYSVGYMADDPSIHRYFAYLNLFMFSMLCLILGKNLFMLFVGWEGVGACSYLLIGFWFTDDAKAQAGQKAFVVNRIGDFGFLIGMLLLLYHAGGSTDYDVLKWHFEQGGWGPFYDPMTLTMACVFLFIGACGKSAQIPLYVWLPDAMAGPTPVSALIHAATMVTAGVYMIARLSFMFTLAPAAMLIIATVGCLTALMGALMALTQRDIKGVLAYSTVSQLGYMIMAVGIGAYVAGVWHLMTHAFFKALLFLGAGSVIHSLGGQQDIMKMGGLRPKMRITAITFLIATLAIAGTPYLSGWFSKDEILWQTLKGRQAVEIPSEPIAASSNGTDAHFGGRLGQIVAGSGNDWRQIQLPPTTQLTGSRQALPSVKDIHVDADGVGWAVTQYNSVYRGEDDDWKLMGQLRDHRKLTALHVVGPDDVWFVGEGGLIARWADGELNTIASGSQANLKAIAGQSDGKLYAAGSILVRAVPKAALVGVILRWNGTSWSPDTSPTKAPVNDLALVGKTLTGVTAGGDVLQLREGQWTLIKVESTQIAQIEQLIAIASGTDTLAVAGTARQAGGTELLPVMLKFNAEPDEGQEAWTPSFSQVGLIPQNLVSVDGALLAGTQHNRLIDATDFARPTVLATVQVKHWLHYILYILACITAGLTAFYMFRLYFLTFEGRTRCDEDTWNHAHESPISMTVPLMILAVLSLFGGMMTTGLGDWLAPSFRIAAERLAPGGHHTLMAWFPTLFAGAGFALAFVWYYKGSLAPRRLAERLPLLFRLSKNKFYVDEIYDTLVIRPYRFVASLMHRVIDVVIIDGLVNLTGRIVDAAGRVVRGVQSGDVQHYAVALVIGLAGLIWLMGI